MASQMFTHMLNPLKSWPRPHALDMAGKLHSAVTIDPFPAGRVVHIHSMDTSHNPSIGGIPLFKTGIEDTDMALFTFQGSTDTDVSNDGDTDWYAVAPTGVINTLVAVGAYELETTEFDTTRTYSPNDALTAVANDTDDTADTGGGNLTNDCEVYTDPVCGVVSRGSYTNAYQNEVLAFWPVWLPADPCSEGPCGPQA